MPHCADCQRYIESVNHRNDDGDPQCGPCAKGFTIT